MSKVGRPDHENTKDLRLAKNSHRRKTRKTKDIITKARKKENAKERNVQSWTQMTPIITEA
jgi:hypothetical protein